MLLFLFLPILAMIQRLWSLVRWYSGLGFYSGLPIRFMFPLLPLDGLLFLPDFHVLALPLATGSGFSWSPPFLFQLLGSWATVGFDRVRGTQGTLVVWRFQLPKGKEDLLHDPGSVSPLQRGTRLRLAGSW
jgi:hypothetical protein